MSRRWTSWAWKYFSGGLFVHLFIHLSLPGALTEATMALGLHPGLPLSLTSWDTGPSEGDHQPSKMGRRVQGGGWREMKGGGGTSLGGDISETQ